MAPRPHELAKSIESMLVRANATAADLDALCDEALARHLAAVAVLPCHVERAAARLRGGDVKLVALISFPFGADVPAVKRAAAEQAARDGADEVEVVMALSAFLSGDLNGARDELAAIVDAMRLYSAGTGRRQVLVRAVIESAYLDDKRVRLAARVLKAAGVDGAVTGTGLAPQTATALDVELLREELDGVLVKSTGGIRTLDQAHQLIAAGATRIGTASAGALLDQAGAK